MNYPVASYGVSTACAAGFGAHSVTVFVGGRSGMISMATGAMAQNPALGVLAGVLLGPWCFLTKSAESCMFKDWPIITPWSGAVQGEDDPLQVR